MFEVGNATSRPTLGHVPPPQLPTVYFCSVSLWRDTNYGGNLLCEISSRFFCVPQLLVHFSFYWRKWSSEKGTSTAARHLHVIEALDVGKRLQNDLICVKWDIKLQLIRPEKCRRAVNCPGRPVLGRNYCTALWWRTQLLKPSSRAAPWQVHYFIRPCLYSLSSIWAWLAREAVWSVA